VGNRDKSPGLQTRQAFVQLSCLFRLYFGGCKSLFEIVGKDIDGDALHFGQSEQHSIAGFWIDAGLVALGDSRFPLVQLILRHLDSGIGAGTLVIVFVKVISGNHVVVAFDGSEKGFDDGWVGD
jgi:hypothetical protein